MGARRYKSLSPSKLISWRIRQGTTEVIKWHPFWGGGSNNQQIDGNFGGFPLDIVHEVWAKYNDLSRRLVTPNGGN